MKTKLTVLAVTILLFGQYLIAQQQIKDIRPGSGSSNPRNLISYNGLVYFSADTSITGNNPKLWRSDGTSAGTILLSSKNVHPSGGFDKKASANGYVFFGAYDPVFGYELHKTDGTVSGTNLVKDIFIGSNGSQIKNLFEFNGNVYFEASNGWDNCELWKSDGTSAGTIMVQDIRPGQYGSLCITSSGETGSRFAILNNELYFSAWDGGQATAPELWKTDGTTTVKVKTSSTGDFGRYPHNLFTFNGNVYFSAYTLVGGNNIEGRELYISDGTDNGTQLLKNINPANYQNSSPDNFTTANNTLFFSADDGSAGRELWKTDGTQAGTVLVKDIYVVGTTSSSMITPTVPFIAFNNSLFFSAYNTSGGAELWKSDGTLNGTVMVKDILPGTNNSYPNNFCEASGVLFFAATNSIGTELWKSDGTTSGTTLAQDISVGSPSSTPYWLTNNNGTLFFSANNGINGTELWKYDASLIGIKEENKSRIFVNIYPNPTNGKINIELDDSKETELTVYNLTGLKIIVKNINSKTSTLDLSNLSNGVYSLQIKNENGVTTKKIILNK